MRRRLGGGRLIALSVHAYRALLLAYPPDFRRDFGDEMARAFRDSCRDAVAYSGPPALVPLWLRTLCDLAGSTAGEWCGASVISRRRAHIMLGGHSRRWQIARQRGFDPFEALRDFWRGVTRPPHGRLALAVGAFDRGTPMNDRDRFDKFTERAKHVLALSQDEALRLHHNYIGTEHLLLGLLREGDTGAARVLRELGVDLDASREQVELLIGRGHHIVHGDLRVNPRVKRVLELAYDEMRRLNHHYVDPQHLLLGLIREGNGLGVRILERQGVKLEEARTAVLRLLGERGA